MKITEEEARLAGELTNKVEGWTDEELQKIIALEKLFVAFLSGKGSGWQLARIPLQRELDQFRDFVEARKRFSSRHKGQ